MFGSINKPPAPAPHLRSTQPYEPNPVDDARVHRESSSVAQPRFRKQFAYGSGTVAHCAAPSIYYVSTWRHVGTRASRPLASCIYHSPSDLPGDRIYQLAAAAPSVVQ